MKDLRDVPERHTPSRWAKWLPLVSRRERVGRLHRYLGDDDELRDALDPLFERKPKGKDKDKDKDE